MPQISRNEGQKALAELIAFLASLFLTPPTDAQVNSFRKVLDILKVPFPDITSLHELKREFFNLFMVPNPRYVKPYESVYRNRIQIDYSANTAQGTVPKRKYLKGLLMGVSAREIMKLYSRAGLYPEGELPDHIGNELTLLSYLFLKGMDAPPEESKMYKKLEKTLRERHILKWIGKLETKISENDRSGYYATAVAVTGALLREHA